MSLEGQQLGEFEILERLGQGGMGAVYKARQTSLGRMVALKTLQASLAENAEYIARFRREAQAAAGLSHPNLVQVYSAGESGGLYWFAMEYVEGESAKARLTRKGRLDPLEALAIATHVANALEYAWRKAALIHRDIKPDNIFLSGDGDVKLGDLGLAKSEGQTEGLTVSGAAMGTPHYLSPEQAESMKEVDLRADIYSLGCTLYHLLAGRPAYEGRSAGVVMMKHMTAPVPNLRGIWPECPAELAAVVAKMMRKKPADRQQSYEEVNTDLRWAYDAVSRAGVRPSGAARPKPAVVEKKGGVPMAAWVGGGAALLAAVAALVYFAPWKKGGENPGGTRSSVSPGVGPVSPPAVAGGDTPARGDTRPTPAATPASDRMLAVATTPPPAATPVSTNPAPAPQPSPPTTPVPATPAPAATPKPATEVEKWLAEVDAPQQAAFEKQVLKPFESGVADLRARYLASLDAAIAKASAAGQLAEALTWRTERQAFAPAQNVAADDAATPAGVKALRAAFRQQLARLDQDRTAQAKALLAAYDAILAKYQTLLTQHQRLDDALLLNTKRAEIAHAWLGPSALISVGDAGAAAPPQSAKSVPPMNTLAATKEQPFVNGLGMKFVPVPITGGPTAGKTVLFSVWDTRVQDYQVFVDETKHEWPKPDFEQGPTHPAVMVSWEDAQLFCQWLTARYQPAGRLPVGFSYRLPSDHEWSCAVGIGVREDAAALPSEKSGKISDAFPWGTQWPPPKGVGNYAPSLGVDTFDKTSLVGSFAANRFGLYDMGGNVWQWCEDWFKKDQKDRVLRGASWGHDDRSDLLSSGRERSPSDRRIYDIGFRCVLAPVLVDQSARVTSETPSKLTVDGFRPLFDGRTLAGWRALDRDAEPDNWRVTDGALTGTPPSYLMTREEFGDFDLSLEWRVGGQGNGGVFYRINGNGSNVQPAKGEASSMARKAVEFQLADDRSVTKPEWFSGAAWGVLAPTVRPSRPPGEWNTARLVVQGGKVEHWINDWLVCHYDLADPATRAAFQRANNNTDFSATTRSHVALQSFGGEVYYRNLRIRETGGTPVP